MSNIPSLRSRDVEREMRLWDKLGDEKYRAKGGFKEPTKFWVRSNEFPDRGPYPSKAIAGGACGKIHSEFSGGYARKAKNLACDRLEQADFTIVDKSGERIISKPTRLSVKKDFNKRLLNIGESEINRIGRERVGQDVFREALLDYWDRKCLVTEISDRALLRASHIVPWSKCLGKLEKERLNPENGLLLSALWDAAFDKGLVSFSNEGKPLASSKLSKEAQTAMFFQTARQLTVTKGHMRNLAWHRKHIFVK